MKSRQINGIVIHCSATSNGQWHNVQEIDRWHQARGFKREDAFRQRFNPDLLAIGYHFIIYPNGAAATGRHIDEVGAHAKNFNSKTIGVCLLGLDRFTQSQWETLSDIARLVQKQFPNARVIGHRDLPKVKKTCPGFDVSAWLTGGMNPLSGHILEA